MKRRTSSIAWLAMSFIVAALALAGTKQAQAQPEYLNFLQQVVDGTATPEETALPETVTATVQPTSTITATIPSPIFMPLVYNQPELVPETIYYRSEPALHIPDFPAGEVQDTVSISDERAILDINIYLDIRHAYTGDLVVYLEHAETGTKILLLDRPGNGAGSGTCGIPNVRSILDDEMSLKVDDWCGADLYPALSPAALAGIFQPTQPLSVFNGEPAAGTWNLIVSDQSKISDGYLKAWWLVVTLGKPSQVPPPPPPTPELPQQAYIDNVSSFPQNLPLDCESRVAIDWARFFGVRIGEFEFFNKLPLSLHPDTGFVGDVYGVWGQVPPGDYGVHAEPVAEVLRNYGLNAYAHKGLSFDDLRAEVAAGRPVFIWVVGNWYGGYRNSVPVYFPSDQPNTVVAAYEHVGMVIGYTESRVTVIDSGVIRSLPIPKFLSVWSALGNMAITTQP